MDDSTVYTNGGGQMIIAALQIAMTHCLNEGGHCAAANHSLAATLLLTHTDVTVMSSLSTL